MCRKAALNERQKAEAALLKQQTRTLESVMKRQLSHIVSMEETKGSRITAATTAFWQKQSSHFKTYAFHPGQLFFPTQRKSDRPP